MSDTAAPALDLSVDEVLTTTRSVRKRLDLDRPVPREVLMECLELALQAPTGSNSQGWHRLPPRQAAPRRAGHPLEQLVTAR